MPEHSGSILKQATIQIASGGCAGFVEVCVMHPLDVIKTRMQLQSTKSAVFVSDGVQVYYDGIIDCCQKMLKLEGGLSFYKGILPPILAETPKRAVKFFTFEQYKKLFMFGSSFPTPLTFSLAGACAGVTEAIFVNPFEVVKISMQSNIAKKNNYPSTWTVTKEILRNDGFKGLNKGLSGTMARNGLFNCVYFGFYHTVKNLLPQAKDEVGEFFRKLLIGFAAGTLGSCFNIPFDVVKSRIQGPQAVVGQVKYKKLFPSMKLIYKEEGWRALYKGIVPKVMRLGPGGAIMLVVYDYAHNFLQEKLSQS